MRDHTKLKAFQLADELAILVYQDTKRFPREEQFGLKSQMRRAAVSVPSNIVEGCARSGESDYLRFLDIAFGSLRELKYQLSLSSRLGFIDSEIYKKTDSKAEETSKVITALIRALRKS